jgi:hypothetical protein
VMRGVSSLLADMVAVQGVAVSGYMDKVGTWKQFGRVVVVLLEDAMMMRGDIFGGRTH